MQSVILGTAQWGLDYGVTNAVGRLSDEEIQGLGNAARGFGVRALDTAPAYGDAEERIGSLAESLPVQTKVSIDRGSGMSVRSSLSASLGRLRRERLAAVLVHDWSGATAEARQGVAEVLEQMREEGIVDAVGVSVYGRADVTAALESFGRLDVVQAPVSLLDQRLEGAAELLEVRSRGGRVQARSVFLQGAALASEDHSLFGDHPDVARLRSTGRPVDLCLGYVASREWVDDVVVAATTVTELQQIMTSLASPLSEANWTQFASSDLRLVDPRQWTQPTGRG